MEGCMVIAEAGYCSASARYESSGSDDCSRIQLVSACCRSSKSKMIWPVLEVARPEECTASQQPCDVQKTKCCFSALVASASVNTPEAFRTVTRCQPSFTLNVRIGSEPIIEEPARTVLLGRVSNSSENRPVSAIIPSSLRSVKSSFHHIFCLLTPHLINVSRS